MGDFIGVTVNGVLIRPNTSFGPENFFSYAQSLDACQGYTDSRGVYQYWSEPYSISYQDNSLIGVLMDGFWVYGRKDYDGTDVSLELDNTPSSSLYVYGGHVGSNPLNGEESNFHYHVTQWSSCLDLLIDENKESHYSDDGSPECTHTSNGVLTGRMVTGYFLSGHGNGGVFSTIPNAVDNGGKMLNSIPSVRYYFGIPGDWAQSAK